jgi:dipeptidyl aminopeptidase/acylaminoacyl peptidase
MRSGDPEIWVWESDGSNPNQLTYFKGPATGTPRWSPDGRWIAFTSGSEGQADIYAIDADGGLPKRLTNDAANDISPSWSRDGKWIYFASNRSGQLQIWRMAVAPHLAARPAQTIQVTKNGGSASFESLDGKTLYYAKDWSLWSVPTEGGEELQILDSLHMQSFAVSRQGIFFVPRSEPTAPGRIRFFDFSTRRLSDVLALDKPAFIGLAVSHDGRRLLFSQVDREDSDLMLLDNFCQCRDKRPALLPVLPTSTWAGTR